MPQPISNFKVYGCHIANQTDSPAQTRPELALAAMEVIAQWSLLENWFMNVFVLMLGTNPRPATAIYTSITGDHNKRAALLAIARTILTEDEQDVLEALLALQNTCAKDRNKIAHWLWGHSPELPDAVLLMDPEVKTQHFAEQQESRARYEEAMARRRTGKSKEPPPKRIGFSREGIFVFTKQDFVAASERINRLIGYVGRFYAAVNRDGTAWKDGRALSGLSAMPEVREVLDRQHQRRKT